MAILPAGFNFVPIQEALLNKGLSPLIQSSYARGINTDEFVVGGYKLQGDPKHYGFVWDMNKGTVHVGVAYDGAYPGPKLPVGSIPAPRGTRLHGINDEGVIVGRIDYGPPDKITQSYAFQLLLSDVVQPNALIPDSFVILGEDNPGLPKGFTSLHAHGINNQNQIVGIYGQLDYDPKGEPVLDANNEQVILTRGFKYTPDAGPMPAWTGTFERKDPPALTPPDPESQFSQVFDINDSGEMVGSCGPVSLTDTFFNLAYWWDANLTPHKVDLTPLGDVGITYGINNDHWIAGGAVDSSKVSVDPPIMGPGVGWLSKIDEKTLSVSVPQMLHGPIAQLFAFGQFPHFLEIPYGHVNILGIGDNRWLLGEATKFPEPKNSSLGSEAFVLVPLSPAIRERRSEFHIHRYPIIDPNWWFPGPGGPLLEVSPEYRETFANLVVSQAALQVADPKQRRELQEIALKGAMESLRGLLNKAKEK